MANMPITATIINGVLPPLSEFKQSMAFQSAYDSREKPVAKALLHPPDACSDAWISVHLPLKSCRSMDKGGIQIGLLGRGYLPHPTLERSYRTGASGAQTDRRGTMLYDIGNSERTGQELRYEWLLSTSKGSNGLRGDSGSGFRSFSFFLWVTWRKRGRLGERISFWHLACGFAGEGGWSEWLNECFFSSHESSGVFFCI